MLNKLRQRARDEKGFTLIELLVVILIIGILAAIALPAFLNQREKAQDTEAKSSARTVQTAQETYYTDNQAYTDDVDALKAIEPAIGQFEDRLSVELGDDGFTATVESKSSDATTFSVVNDGATVTRTCSAVGGGCKEADDAGNQW